MTDPITPDRRQAILAKLKQIEIDHEVTILYASESGSRAWGFESPDSDYDVRFIYMHTGKWYLNLEAGRDVIELPFEDDLDINGWDLRKALNLMQVSNPALMEWLHSPIVYIDNRGNDLRQLAIKKYDHHKAFQHYFSMAEKTYQQHLRKEMVRYKKYLYALRPLLAIQWLLSEGTPPPVAFSGFFKLFPPNSFTLENFDELLSLKKDVGEKIEGPHLPFIITYIEDQIKQFKDRCPEKGESSTIDDLNEYFFEMVQSTVVEDRWDVNDRD